MRAKKRPAVWSLAALLVMAAASYLPAQNNGTAQPTETAAAAQPAEVVPQTGLLPLYGVDFSFDQSWVDGSSFPSQSADHPNFGVNATFQQVWDALKPTGANCIRFRVDVRDAQNWANRLANLCVWARSNGVNLVPVLVGADRGSALDDSFPKNAASLSKALGAAFRGDGQNLQAYSQILGFQVEDKINHTGLHGKMSAEAATALLLKAAAALRAAEQEALKDTGVYATPIIVSVSFDYELVQAKAMAGVPLSDAAYDQACQSMKQFLARLTASQDVDVVNIEWFAGSIGAGSVDKLPVLLRSLKEDLVGKQVAFTTGFSTGFNAPADQKQYYVAAFTNLADYRVREATEGTFLGVFFHEAMDSTEADPAPPTAELPSEMLNWDWSAKSEELASMWKGTARSAELAWWLSKSENHMGLLSMKSDPSAGTTLTPQPAQEALLQIAGVVTEANTAVAAENAASAPAAGDTSAGMAPSGESPGMSFKSKIKEGLLGLLDKVFQKIGDKILATGAASSGGGFYESPPPADMGLAPGATPVAATTPAPGSIILAPTDISFSPPSPQVGQEVNAGVTIHNQSPDTEAMDLVVALVDSNGFVLGGGAQQSGISVGPNAAKSVDLSWTASTAGTASVFGEVYDASLAKIASAQVELTVADAPGGQGSSEVPGSIECTKAKISVVPPNPHANAPVKLRVTVGNKGSEDASGLDLLLLDVDADPSTSLLAEVDGNSVAGNSEKKVDLDWMPAAEKSYKLAVQVWQGFDKMLAEANLDPLAVSAAQSTPGESGTGGESGSVGIHPGGFRQADRAALKLPKPWPGPPGSYPCSLRSTIPPGLPRVQELVIGEQAPMSGKTTSVTLGLVNPYPNAIRNLSVTLLADGKIVQTKSLGALLHGQNRTVVFPNAAALGAGKHSFEVMLKGGSGKQLMGSAKGEINVSTRMLATAAAISSGRSVGLYPTLGSSALARSSRMTAGAAAVRSTLPPTFNIGGREVMARAPSASLAPLAPVSSRLPSSASEARIATVTPPTTSTRVATRPIAPDGTGITPTGPGAGTTPAIPGVRPTTPTVPPSPLATRPVPTIPGVTPPASGTTVEGPIVTAIPGVTPTAPLKTETVQPGAATIAPTAPTTSIRPTTPTTSGATAATTTVRPTTIPGVAPPSTATGTPTTVSPSKGTSATTATASPTTVRTSVTPTLKPDLSITPADIRCNPPSPKAGDQVTFGISVRNLANAAASGAKVVCVLRADRVQVGSKGFTVDVAPKGVVSVQWQVKTTKAKQYSLEVVVSHPSESITTNNRATATFNASE